MAPNAVNDAASEERVVGRAHPVEERDSRILAFGELDFRPAQRLGRQRLVRVGIQQSFGQWAGEHFAHNLLLSGLALQVLREFRVRRLKGLLAFWRNSESDLAEDVGKR